ncbi:hypothetical protein CAP36_04325 [Chitinophagaceae bacterium IBVUCB2]|nr:hypothetical protein CAP36_04325 [Chitinophagaceae bacterium IBVUCB2]
MLTNFFKAIDKVVLLNEEEKAILTSLFQIVNVGKGDFLLKEGEICKYEFFILKGLARTYYIDEVGEEHTAMFAFSGWWTGDLISFQKRSPSKNYIQTLEPSTIIRITHSDQASMFKLVPKLEKYFRILFQNRVVALEEALEARQSLTASEVYHAFTKKHAAYMKQIPLKHLASYLNITPGYLSRIRSKKKY